jgi:hypothetical protein
MNINASSSSQTGPKSMDRLSPSIQSGSKTMDRLSSPMDSASGPSSANTQRSRSQSPVDRFAQNASDLKQIKRQFGDSSSAQNASVTGSAQVQSLQSGVIGQNGIVSKSVQGLPQPQNLPSTLSILKNRQNTQNPVGQNGPGAYTFAKTYVEKTVTPNATALLGSGVQTKKNPPTPNPALSPPPPRGAQLQLYAPSLKAGNKALDIQDHGINAF